MAFIKNSPQSVGFREINYDDEKVTITMNSSSTEYKYSAFKKIEEDNNYFYLFTGDQTALTLPKTIKERDSLLNLIEKIRANCK